MAKPESFLHADVANLLAEVDALFVAYPELSEDETLRADMLEGETAAYDVLSRLVAIERESDNMSTAIAGRIAALGVRKAREDKRKEAMRKLMLRIMQAGDIQKAKLVEATVSIAKGRDSVHITDESAIAKRYLKVVTSPDKTKIGEDLKAGKKVKGAEIKTGEPTLQVR